MKTAHLLLLGMLLTLAAFAAPAHARNVDLSTVPGRDTVTLTIYNSEDLTLVRETRAVTFKKGNNPLQFSWANTRIDPTSVELRFLDQAAKLEVVDTTFPHDKPAMLYWNVDSAFDGEARIEITYFTSGLTWAADYTCIADRDEKQMHIDGFVRVTNNSGEDYENAKVRLVVGTINLVEKLAQLTAGQDQGAGRKGMMNRLVKTEMLQAERKEAAKAIFASGSADAVMEKIVEKEALGEYFLYTIEGTETIPNGWSKRMRSFEGSDCPFKIQYRYRPEEYGDQLVRMYLLTNDKPSKLGTTPLPDGEVRVFRDNGRDGLSFLAAQSIKYVSIGDKIELNLGPDPQVLFELIPLQSTREEIWLQVHGGDVFQKVGGGVAIDVNASVAGWDERAKYTQRVRNFSPKAIDVEVRRAYDGHVIFRSSLNPKLHDYRTVEFTATVPAGQKADLLHEVVLRQGRNAKQNNVTLENGPVNP